jgi:hypothetical protein
MKDPIDLELLSVGTSSVVAASAPPSFELPLSVEPPASSFA